MNRLCKAVYADLKGHIEDFPICDPPVDCTWINKFAVDLASRMEVAIKDHVTCGHLGAKGVAQDAKVATGTFWPHRLSKMCK